jgi:citrate synthase
MANKSYTLIAPDGTKTELPVLSPTLDRSVLKIAHLYGERGVFTFDLSFAATAACESSVTYIDGEKGVPLIAAFRSSSSPRSRAHRGLYLLLHGERRRSSS